MQSEKASFVELLFTGKITNATSSQPTHSGWLLVSAIGGQPLRDRNLWQADILHHRPHDGQTTGFCREGVNRIGALPDIAKETFNGIGTANVAMHDRRESIKRQKMLFIFTKTADGFGIALLIFGFKGRQIEQRILFLLLLEDPG